MKHYLAVDVGGTKIMAGLVDETGRVLAEKKYPMVRTDRETAVETVLAAAEDFASSLTGLPAPCALGLGTVGHIDPEAGIWLQSYNIPIDRPVEMVRLLTERTGLPAAMDNDVRCAARGEYRFGKGRGFRVMLYLNVGTGIGSSVIHKGMLLTGADNYAGEVGYFVMNHRGEPKRLEPLASGGGLIAAAKALLPDYPDSCLHQGELHSQSIFEAARAGDALGVRLAGEAVDALGTAFANLASAYNPDAIILGGGVVKDSWFLNRAEEKMRALCLPETLLGLKEFAPSTLDPARVGMLGAAALAMEVLG